MLYLVYSGTKSLQKLLQCREPKCLISSEKFTAQNHSYSSMNLCLRKILPWSDGNLLFANGTPGIFQRHWILITLSLIFSWCETAAPVRQNVTTAHKTSTHFAQRPSMKARIERFCQTRWRKDNLAHIIVYTSSLAAGNSALRSYCSNIAPPPRTCTFLHSPSCWPVLINKLVPSVLYQTQ